MTIDKEFESFLFSQDDGEMYSSAYRRAWQAATEQSQKEIAELEANNDKVILALASIRNIFEYDDEMVRSGALRFPEAVAGFVKTKVAELQAREKVLVEALESILETGLLEGSYDLHTKADKIARKALANVRGEVK